MSSPFPVLALDLQQRVDAKAGAALTNISLPKKDFMWESDTQLKIHATADGVWNGVAFWFEVGLLLSCCFGHLTTQGEMHDGPAAKSAQTVSDIS